MNETVSRKTNISVASVGILTFTGILIETSLNVTFPTLMSTFNEPLAVVQWLTTGYLLMVTLMMGATAFLLKRFKARRLFLVASSLAIIGGILCLFAPEFWLLMLGRLLQAAATGIATPLMFSVVFNKVPAKKWGTYTGICAMLISLAPALGPTYGGIMNHYLTWRYCFVFVVILLGLALVAGLLNFEDNETYPQTKFNLLSFIYLISFLTSLEFGLQQLSSRLGLAVGLIILSLVCLALFIFRSLTKANPLIDLRILKDSYVSWRLVDYFGLQFTNISLSFIIPIFAENYLHVNSLVAGLMLLPGSLAGAIIAPMSGRWYDKSGANKPIPLGNFLMLLGAVLFAGLTKQLTIALIVIFYIFTRAGFNTAFGNVMTDSGKAVPLAKKADQNSLFSMSQQYAGSLGTAIISGILTFAQKGSNTSLQAIKVGSQLSFGFLAIISFIGLLSVIILHKRHVPAKKQFDK